MPSHAPQDAASFRSILRQVAQDQGQQGLLDEQAAAGGGTCGAACMHSACMHGACMHGACGHALPFLLHTPETLQTGDLCNLNVQGGPRCCRCSGAST